MANLTISDVVASVANNDFVDVQRGPNSTAANIGGATESKKSSTKAWPAPVEDAGDAVLFGRTPKFGDEESAARVMEIAPFELLGAGLFEGIELRADVSCHKRSLKSQRSKVSFADSKEKPCTGIANELGGGESVESEALCCMLDRQLQRNSSLSQL